MGDIKTKAAFFGAAFHTGNLGVAALAASVIDIFLNLKSDLEFTLFIPHNSCEKQTLIVKGEEIAIDVVNYRLSLKSKLSEHLFWIFFLYIIYKFIRIKKLQNIIINSNTFLKNIYESDIVFDIRGGDNFSDIYGLGNFIIDSIPRIIASNLNKRFILLPQTYGPYDNIIAKKLAGNIMNKSELIFSRDKESISIVNSLVSNKYNNKKIQFCPDVAFKLKPIRPNNIITDPSIDTIKNKKVNFFGLNVSGLLYKSVEKKGHDFNLNFNYEQFIDLLINNVLNETKFHILLCPHTYGINESDFYACQTIIESLPSENKKRVHLIKERYDQNEIKGIIGLCDFFVGARMHSCIAALSQGIPTIGLAYSKKFIGVFKTIDMADYVIDARSTETKEAIDYIIESAKNTNRNKKKELKERIINIQDDISLHLNEIFI